MHHTTDLMAPAATHELAVSDSPSRPALPRRRGLLRGIGLQSWTLWLLAGYLAVIIVRPWELLVPELASWHFERLTVLVMLVVAGLCRGYRLRLSFQACGLVTFLAVVWLSAVCAFRPDLSWPVMIELTGMALCYFFCVRLIRSPEQLFFIVVCYVVTVAAYVAKSEWEYFLHGAFQVRMGVRRLQGIEYSFGHPNQVAMTILYTLPFWYLLTVFYRARSGGWPSFWRRVAQGFLVSHLALSISGILLTRSRAGALGLLGFAVLLAWRAPSPGRRLRNLALVGLIGLLAFGLLPNDMRLRIRSTWDAGVERMAGFKGANTSAEGRWYGLLAGLEMFRHRPWLGVGIGNYKDYRVAKSSYPEYKSAHNLPGELLGELGAAGAAAFALVLLGMYGNWRQVARVTRFSAARDGPMLRQLTLACRDCILLMAYGSLSQHTLQRYQWFLVAAFGVLAVRFVGQLPGREDAADTAGSGDCALA
jgi:O-antigen ligase